MVFILCFTNDWWYDRDDEYYQVRDPETDEIVDVRTLSLSQQRVGCWLLFLYVFTDNQLKRAGYKKIARPVAGPLPKTSDKK